MATKIKHITIFLLLIILYSINVYSINEPIATYAFNPSQGIYNHTFIEDISGNGKNISGNFSGNITLLENGYYKYISNSSNDRSFIIPDLEINTSTTSLILDFYDDNSGNNDDPWYFYVNVKAYSNDGTLHYNDRFLIYREDNILKCGYVGLGVNSFTLEREYEYDRIALRFSNKTVSVFRNGINYGNMINNFDSNVDYFVFEEIKPLSGDSAGPYKGTQVGELNVYNDSIDNLSLIDITKNNKLSLGIEGLIYNYSFNDDLGVYNSTYLEDLSGNNLHANLSGPVVYDITNLENTSFKRYYKAASSGWDGFTVPYTGVSTTIGDLTFDYYLDTEVSKQWINYLYANIVIDNVNKDAFCYTVTESNQFRFYCNNGLGSITANLNPLRKYSHLVFNFNTTNFEVYQDGQQLNVNLSGWDGDLLTELSLSEIRLGNGVTASGYTAVILGPQKLYNGENFNESELIKLSSKSAMDSIDTGLEITYPLFNNIVVQKDHNSNKGNLTLEFSNFYNTKKMNISVNSDTPIEIDITNHTKQNYTIGEYNKGCYNVTISSYIFNDTIYNYCIGEVVVIMGQSNSNRFGSGFNYSSVDYNLSSDEMISAFSTSEGEYYTGVGHYDKYFDSNDTSTWVSGVWAPLMYGIANTQNTPVMIFNTGMGGREIEYFLPGEEGHATVTKNVDQAFRYSNKASFIIWMQGEGNSYTVNYEDLVKNNLTNEWNIWFDFEFENPYLLIPPGNYGASTTICEPKTGYSWPQYAEYKLASENVSYFIPASVNDIETANYDNCIHMANVSFDAYQYAMRVYNGVLSHVYGLNLPLRPELEAIFYYDDNTVALKYDRPIKLENSHGIRGDISYGLRLYDSSGDWFDQGEINNDNIISSKILNEVYILTTFDTDISAYPEASYCARAIDCYNKTVIRSSNSIFPSTDPATPFYRLEIETSEALVCDANGKFFINGQCVSQTEKACNTIAEQVFDSFNIGVVALIVLVASLLIGILMTAFGGAGFDSKTLMAGITTVVISAILFVVGIVIFGIVSGTIC